MKKDAQLPALDEKVPVDGVIMSGQNDNTETYFMAGNTEGDDSGVTVDSIRLESAPVNDICFVLGLGLGLGLVWFVCWLGVGDGVDGGGEGIVPALPSVS